MELKNKVVVITGGCRGFGLELSKQFSLSGSKVVVCDKVCNVEDNEVHSVLTCDVTKEEEVASCIENIIKKFGQIDIWINNAGVWIPHKKFEDVSLEDARRIHEINFLGTFVCSKHIIPYFKKQKGSLINIVSTSALGPRPTTAIYSASKFAVNGFTKAIREEVRDFGIKVLSVFPGAMKTGIFNEGVPDDFKYYMEAEGVAKRVVENIKREDPEEELLINNK